MTPIEKLNLILIKLEKKEVELVNTISFRLNSEDSRETDLKDITNLFKKLTLNNLTRNQITLMTNSNNSETNENTNNQDLQ